MISDRMLNPHAPAPPVTEDARDYDIIRQHTRARLLSCSQWVVMCGNGATLILPKMEQEGGWLKSHKHHKSTERMVSGGDPKRELGTSWGQA